MKRSPDDRAFAVKRFSPIVATLADQTGVDPSSLRLSVGSLGTYAVDDPELSYREADKPLTFDPGGLVALGDFGEELTVALSVSDPLGHGATYDWSFKTEVEPIVSANLFVFGSIAALRTGQERRDLPEPTLTGRFEADVSLNLTPDGPALEGLEPAPTLSLALWEQE